MLLDCGIWRFLYFVAPLHDFCVRLVIIALRFAVPYSTHYVLVIYPHPNKAPVMKTKVAKDPYEFAYHMCVLRGLSGPNDDGPTTETFVWITKKQEIRGRRGPATGGEEEQELGQQQEQRWQEDQSRSE